MVACIWDWKLPSLLSLKDLTQGQETQSYKCHSQAGFCVLPGKHRGNWHHGQNEYLVRQRTPARLGTGLPIRSEGCSAAALVMGIPGDSVNVQTHQECFGCKSWMAVVRGWCFKCFDCNWGGHTQTCGLTGMLLFNCSFCKYCFAFILHLKWKIF